MASLWVKSNDGQQADEILSVDEELEDIWDDTALILAYDRAVNSFKNGGENRSSDTRANKSNGVNKKKKRKNMNKDPSPQKEIQWKVGDKCQAVYSEDGLLYMGKITEIDLRNRTCVVKFDYYDNIETVNLNDIYDPDFGSKERKNDNKVPGKQQSKWQKEQYQDHSWSIGDICAAYNPKSRKREEAVIIGLSPDKCDLTFVESKMKQTVRISSIWNPNSQKDSDCCNCGGYESNATRESYAQNMCSNFDPPFYPPPPSEMFFSMPPSFPHPFPPSPYREFSARQSKRSFNRSFDPSIPPPPPPLPLPSQLEDGDHSALANMLMSWYMVGYHTGYYQGTKKNGPKSNTSRCSDEMDQCGSTSDGSTRPDL